MKRLLLIELLESFSEKEIEGLSHFVSCFHFNTDQYVIRLLNTLRKSILWKSPLDSKMQVMVYQKVFPNKSEPKQVLNDKQQLFLRAKTSALLRLTEQFLTIDALQSDEACKSELLHQKLLEKKQFRLLRRRINQFRKEKGEQIKNIPHYHYQYKTETGILNYLYRSGQWVATDNLSALNQNLDIYYLLNKLKLHITALSFMGTSAQKQYNFSDMEALQSLLDLPAYAAIPLIQVYQAIIDLMNHKTDETYTIMLGLLAQHEACLSTNDLNDFYVVATNFCAHQIKLGKSKYYHHLFDLHQTMDNKNLLLEGNLIPVGRLKNIISISCRVGKFDRAVHITNKYYPFVREEIRDNVRDFNLGSIAFYQKDYQTAIDYLHSLDNINLTYDIGRRVMIVKSYYEIETEYKETTAQVFLSMEKYIKGNKSLTVKDKTAYKNFIRILINLYHIRHNATKMSLERIKDKLEHQALNSDKQWLLDKMEALRK